VALALVEERVSLVFARMEGGTGRKGSGVWKCMEEAEEVKIREGRT
jgi:hypothetical protein